MFSRKRYLLAATALLCLLGAVNARANMLQALPNMGDLLRWGAFSLGGGIVTDDDATMVGTTDIYGDVGIAGNGNLTMTGNSTIHGDLYWRSNGTLTMKGNAKVTGNKFHNMNSVLDNGVTEAMNSSALAASYASSTLYSGINSITMSMTLNAQHDRPGNSTVLNLMTFNLGNNQTLTLNGAANDVFIFNISGTFVMGAQSQILLTGGLSWDDVLFNVRGSGTNVTLNAQSTLRGVLMANNRTVTMDGGALVYGEVVSDKLTMKGGSQIQHPPLSSP